MHSLSQYDTHLQNALARETCRRAFAVRLDMTLKRSKVRSSRIARSLGVNEDVVAMWRAGVTVPRGSQCRQLAELLKVEADWLCVVRP